MTTTVTAPVETPLTYESYMAEPQIEGQYDIINGVRIFMPGAGLRHQRIAGNVEEILRQYERASRLGIAASAPSDVLIQRTPKLQTRQPDVMFITHTRLVQNGGIPTCGPLQVPPSLVVEIISNSETQRILGDKLADFGSIGVEEA